MVISRRALFGIVGAVFVLPRARTFRLQAIAAANMPHTRTIQSSDAKVAAHFAEGGVFEIREYANGSRLLLFDTVESRWRSRIEEGAAPIAISLYRPA